MPRDTFSSLESQKSPNIQKLYKAVAAREQHRTVTIQKDMARDPAFSVEMGQISLFWGYPLDFDEMRYTQGLGKVERHIPLSVKDLNDTESLGTASQLIDTLNSANEISEQQAKILRLRLASKVAEYGKHERAGMLDALLKEKKIKDAELQAWESALRLFPPKPQTRRTIYFSMTVLGNAAHLTNEELNLVGKDILGRFYDADEFAGYRADQSENY